MSDTTADGAVSFATQSPDSGHSADGLACPFCAINGHPGVLLDPSPVDNAAATMPANFRLNCRLTSNEELRRGIVDFSRTWTAWYGRSRSADGSHAWPTSFGRVGRACQPECSRACDCNSDTE